MIEVAIFTFNDFQENTYVVYNEENECIIFDPGCNNPMEEKQLSDFIETKGLKPVRLINTHAHIDHILGNTYVAETYGLELEMHKGEMKMLQAAPMIAGMYAISYTTSPEPSRFIEEGEKIKLGNEVFEAILAPGHSTASLCFLNQKNKFLISGDVIFQGSIGRTDLPGGDYDTLISSIKRKILILDDDIRIYPGHGPATTVGYERMHNPFLN